MNLKARLFVVSLLAAGCSSKTDSTEATTTVAEAIADAQDSDVPMVGREGRELLEGIPVDARRWEHEGIQCDTTPESTTVDVCGQTLAADLHLAWSDCEARFKGRGGRDWHCGGPPGAPPEDGRTNVPSDPAAPAGPVSSGSVDVVTTIEPTAACADGVALRFQQQSTHDVTHTLPDGQVVHHTGTVSSVAVGVTEKHAQSRSTTIDTQRTRVDADGSTLESIHLTGTLDETFDATTTPPTRTSSGTLTEAQADGSSSTVTMTDVKRVPPSECAWPVSGTLQRTAADGTTQVLVYGPECGQATLDGETITLPSRPHHGGGKGGPGGDHGPGPGPGGGAPRPDGSSGGH